VGREDLPLISFVGSEDESTCTLLRVYMRALTSECVCVHTTVLTSGAIPPGSAGALPVPSPTLQWTLQPRD